MIRDLQKKQLRDKPLMISVLLLCWETIWVMSKWFVQSPNDKRSSEETFDRSAFYDFSASSMLAIIGRQVGVMSNWFVQSPYDTRSCSRNS